MSHTRFKPLRWPASALLFATCFSALMSALSPALAQTLTPAQRADQEAIRQQERERQLRFQQERRPDVRLRLPTVVDEKDRLLPEETPCFFIERVVLKGDKDEATALFQWALPYAHHTPAGAPDPATGRCLGTLGINQVMRRVQNAIVARGFVTTRILSAPQDLSKGTLELTVLPGRINSIRFAEGTNERATLINAVPAHSGDILNLRDIEQALENFKRVPTAEADIQIVPTESFKIMPGYSDLIISWKQRLPFRLTVAVDDSGTQTTGKYQSSLTLAYDHWWTLNDLFYLSLNRDLGGSNLDGARGTRGHTAHYSLPWGYGLLAVNSGRNRFHQTVAGIGQTYLYSGVNQTNDVKYSRVVYRDGVRKTTLGLRGWERSSKNFIEDTEIEIQRRRMAGWELGANHRELMGRNTLEANLSYRRGTGAFDALPAPEEATGQGDARLALISADTQLDVPFALGEQRLRYSGVWRAQWNRTPLVPQDRFNLGGRYSVRGFDGESILSADHGWLVRNDVGWALAQSGAELYLGLDYGHVGGSNSELLIGKQLTGAVLGVRGGYKNAAYDLFAGRPLSKPDGFRTASSVVGFNLSASF